jgi:hypothetical protein
VHPINAAVPTAEKATSTRRAALRRFFE